MGDSVPKPPRTCYCVCDDHGRSGEGHGDQDIPSYWNSVKQLWSRTGFNLTIDPSGRVYGSPDTNNPFAVLRLTAVAPTEVQILGVEAKLYLAMDRNGKLYGEEDVEEEGTIFVESYDQNTMHNNYLSRKYGWYVGIKGNGNSKPGPKTAIGQKAIEFLPRQA